MRYVERRPPSDLRADVECFWSLADRGHLAGEPEPVYPDGCVELIVHLADRFRDWSAGEPRSQPGSFLVGPMTRAMWIEAPNHVQTIGVRFRPGGAAAYLAVPLGELVGRVTPLADLWGPAARSLEDELAEGDARRGRWSTLVRFLRSAAGRLRRPEWIGPAVATILSRRGNVRVEDLVRRIGRSRRQVEREFLVHVGHGPKALARIVRFQSVLHQVGRGAGADWVDIALESGYFDQPHLIRDFKAFAGVTPATHARAAGALARLFSSIERLEAYFRRE